MRNYFNILNVLTLHEKPYLLYIDVLKRWSSKKSRTGIWSFLYYQEGWYFVFLENMALFSRQKMKDNLCLKSTWKYDIFCKWSSKMIFPKNLHWDMIFLVLSGEMIFPFPEYMNLFFGRKMKDDLSEINPLRYDIFCKWSGKMVFPKTLHWDMIFLVLWGKMIFLFPGNIILFLRRKMKDHISQKKYMEISFFKLVPPHQLEQQRIWQKVGDDLSVPCWISTLNSGACQSF